MVFMCLLIAGFVFQCSNYSRGLVTGSLCRPLCETNEIKFEKCLGHGVKLHVLRVRWKDSIVILKTPQGLGSDIAVRHAISSLLPGSVRGKESFTMTREMFIDRVGTALCQCLLSLIKLIFNHRSDQPRKMNVCKSACTVRKHT